MEQERKKSALNVQKGIEQPSGLNPEAGEKLRKMKSAVPEPEELFEKICSGDRVALSRAITLVESSLPAHREAARALIEKIIPVSGNSVRIGITGVPGVGKSTFIEAFGTLITQLGHKVAILAIDPSSTRTKGSILGDKTRMEKLSNNPSAFIRPSPSAGTLGGVARKTKEAILLCEAAGFDVVIVETVGVGQSETAVYGMVDHFMLLMLAGAGDELQGIKRGIMEMADMIVINKADGQNIQRAQLAQRQYETALHLFPPAPSGWTPKVLTCSALNGSGIPEIWDQLSEYLTLTRNNGWFEKHRREQELDMFHQTIRETLVSKFYQNPEVKSDLAEAENKISQGLADGYNEALNLLNKHSAL